MRRQKNNMLDNNIFNRGQQPCHEFEADEEDGNLFCEHQCFYCSINKKQFVSFCLNCLCDHHSNGFETCDHYGRTRKNYEKYR